MVVWVYAGGGQAELGVVPFLAKHFPGVLFERRMPERRKLGPRPGVPIHYGATGSSLLGKITSNLTEYWSGTISLLLLLDDLDCDSKDAKTLALRTSAETGMKAAQASVVEPTITPMVVALAVPELEAWLLGDWKNTFEKNHRNCHHAMRHDLTTQGVDFANVESFDSRCESPDTYRKISVVMKTAFDEHCSGGAVHYSKDTDTRRLLMEVDPTEVSKSCPTFRAFWNELKRELEPRL